MSQDEVKLLNPQGEKTLAPATDPKTGDTYACSKVATSLSRIDKVIPKPDPNLIPLIKNFEKADTLQI